jgi:putative ribosome biogenesis GTPase RsgA
MVNFLQDQEKKRIEPFIGPRPFELNKEDQERFFGRDNETDEIITLIYSHKIVLVYAQSGAGKTSIFNGQIIPELEKQGFEVFPQLELVSVQLIK